MDSCWFWSGMVVDACWLIPEAAVQACWLGSGVVVVAGTIMKSCWFGSWVVEASLLRSAVESCWFDLGMGSKMMRFVLPFLL